MPKNVWMLSIEIAFHAIPVSAVNALHQMTTAASALPRAEAVAQPAAGNLKHAYTRSGTRR